MLVESLLVMGGTQNTDLICIALTKSLHKNYGNWQESTIPGPAYYTKEDCMNRYPVIQILHYFHQGFALNFYLGGFTFPAILDHIAAQLCRVCAP